MAVVAIVQEKEFKCKQCGNCCIYFGTQDGIEITQEDFQMWKDANAHYILAFVKTYWRKNKEYASKKIWWDPSKRNRLLPYCPFLYEVVNGDGDIKRKCGIHDLKPEDCREFVTPGWETDMFDCKGYGG